MRRAAGADRASATGGGIAAWRDAPDASSPQGAVRARPQQQREQGFSREEGGGRGSFGERVGRVADRVSSRGGGYGPGAAGGEAQQPRQVREFKLVLREVGKLPQGLDQQDIGELKTGW